MRVTLSWSLLVRVALWGFLWGLVLSSVGQLTGCAYGSMQPSSPANHAAFHCPAVSACN